MFSACLLKDFVESYADVMMMATLQLVNKHMSHVIAVDYEKNCAAYDATLVARMPLVTGAVFKVDPRQPGRIKMKVGKGVLRCTAKRVGVSAFKCKVCGRWHALRYKGPRAVYRCPVQKTRLLEPIPRPYVRVNLINTAHYETLDDRGKMLYCLRKRHMHDSCPHAVIRKRAKHVTTLLSTERMY